MVPEQTGPGFTSTSPALRRSSRICRAGWAAPVVEKGGCAPPIAQAGCVGPDSRICVRRPHLLAGHHVKVPDRCWSDGCYVCFSRGCAEVDLCVCSTKWKRIGQKNFIFVMS